MTDQADSVSGEKSNTAVGGKKHTIATGNTTITAILTPLNPTFSGGKKSLHTEEHASVVENPSAKKGVKPKPSNNQMTAHTSVKNSTAYVEEEEKAGATTVKNSEISVPVKISSNAQKESEAGDTLPPDTSTAKMHELDLSNQDSVEEATIDTEVSEFMIGTKIKSDQLPISQNLTESQVSTMVKPNHKDFANEAAKDEFPFHSSPAKENITFVEPDGYGGGEESITTVSNDYDTVNTAKSTSNGETEEEENDYVDVDNEEVVDEVDKEEKKEQGESISQKASTTEGSKPVFNFAKDETEGYSFASDYNETSLNEDGLNSEFTTEKQKLTDSDDRENHTEEDIVEEKEIAVQAEDQQASEELSEFGESNNMIDENFSKRNDTSETLHNPKSKGSVTAKSSWEDQYQTQQVWTKVDEAFKEDKVKEGFNKMQTNDDEQEVDVENKMSEQQESLNDQADTSAIDKTSHWSSVGKEGIVKNQTLVDSFDDGTYTPAPDIEAMPELERDDQLGGNNQSLEDKYYNNTDYDTSEAWKIAEYQGHKPTEVLPNDVANFGTEFHDVKEAGLKFNSDASSKKDASSVADSGAENDYVDFGTGGSFYAFLTLVTVLIAVLAWIRACRQRHRNDYQHAHVSRTQQNTYIFGNKRN